MQSLAHSANMFMKGHVKYFELKDAVFYMMHLK